MTKQIGLCDVEIPRAVVLRKIKQIIAGKPIQKDAKLALSKAITVFISYLTAHALEQPSEIKHANILSSSRVMTAFDQIGFSELSGQASQRLHEHKAYIRKRAEKKSTKDGEDFEDIVDEEDLDSTPGMDENNQITSSLESVDVEAIKSGGLDFEQEKVESEDIDMGEDETQGPFL